MKVLIIDNYDSFTYNLYQLIGEILEEDGEPYVITIIKNDECSLKEIEEMNVHRIIISPGPGDPTDEAYFGVCGNVIRMLGDKTPILGVCLGMQGMAAVFGGEVVRAEHPMHGKTSEIIHDNKGIYQDLPQKLEVMRYHSLVVKRETLPRCFLVSATVGEEIMGIRHISFPMEGVQFHPESFASEGGREMIRHFLYK